MTKTLTAVLGVSAGLLAGCSITGPGNLKVHEALLYGGTQERIAWVYGSLGTGTQSSVKLGGAAVDLRAQVQDPLALPGTLSVNGKATYRLPTTPLPPRLSLTRDTRGLFNVVLNEGSAVYYTDGQRWTRLNAATGRGVASTPTSGLRGAGNLTPAEADALGSALLGQGPLAVAVLNDSAAPDAPLTVEPAPSEYRRTVLYVLPGVQTVPAASGSVTPAPTPPPTTGTTPGGRVTYTELASGSNAAASAADVRVAVTSAEVRAIYSVAYGRQTGTPTVPALPGGETVVGIFLGQRPTGGYGVRVTGASTQGGTLILTVAITAPGPGSITTQALTSPWTIVRVPGSYQSVQVVDAQGRPFQSVAGGGQTR